MEKNALEIILFIFLFLFIQIANAAVLKNEVGVQKRKSFGLKAACEQFGFKDNLLVDVINPTTIDCMGRELSIRSFCQKVDGGGWQLLRGFASKSKSQIYCEYGETVSLSLSCDEDHFQYCQNAHKGCDELREVFAMTLNLMHSSLTGTPKNLNCYYSISDPLLPQVL